MNSLQILSFVGFTLLVAVITWWKVRKTDTGSQQGYFLAGRSLKAPVIAASLMLTNLSTEQLVGLSGQAYKSGMSVMGWEVTSAVTLIFLALIFLPRYLKRGIATIPDFLEERYDKTTRIIIDFCFLIATGVCFLPIVLYSGALALNSLFHVGESLQLSDGAAIWLLVILLGLAGILYAVIGGLRAMAVADSINGIGLVIGGLMVPVFGLIAMGKGSFMQGIEQLTTVHAEKLNSVGGPTDPLPIGAAFTGLILVNTFYWCTNQGIVQRTLASKSLAEGQKGALLTAVLKMLDPLVLVLPGLIAFHLYQDLPKADMAYPTLVNNVLPVPMVGFFGAVLFGAVISTFNGFLNSASTLFSMGIYRRIINQNAEPQQLVTVGRKFGFFIAIVSVLVALISTVLSVMLTSMAGWALVRYQFRGKILVTALIFGTMTLPYFVVVVPQFIMVARDLGLSNTWVALIVPPLFNSLGVLFMRQAFSMMPRELFDAAQIEGVKEWQIFTRVALPLAKPTLAALAIILFLASWNNYLWPLLIASEPTMMTAPSGICPGTSSH